MKKYSFALIGSGWRSLFFIRAAKALPELFTLTGVLIRNEEKARAFSQEHGVPTTTSMDELLRSRPDFVILSVKRGCIVEYLSRLFDEGLPVLSETPAADNMRELSTLWEMVCRKNGRMQVAEQYFLQPYYSAFAAVIDKGLIGNVQNITLSALQDYHAVSIIRRFLGVGFEGCTLRGAQFSFDTAETFGRDGLRFDGTVTKRRRDRITFAFDSGKTAFYDFSDVQYHSFIRTRQMNVQGECGEIDDFTVRYLGRDNIPCEETLSRVDVGRYNIQEWSTHRLMLGGDIVYQNPYYPARLNDDELAVAACMEKMGEYARGGPEFYPLREALQDAYLSFLMQQALQTPYQEIKTEPQRFHV